MTRPERILVAEHRDEVFARLATDLREKGYTVFRTSQAVDVRRMYSYGQIELVLYDFDLTCENARLNAMKLRMFDAYARIWVYVPWKETLDQQNVNLSRIERVVDFQGDLFRLEDQIRQHLRQLAPRWSDTRATCRQSAQASLEANVVRRMEGWHALFDSAFPLAQLQMAILTATSLDRPP